MASTFSQTLRLELIGEGEQSGLWGQTTNTNLGTLLEQAITGVVNITMADANYTLTNFNGVSDEARNAVLVVGGTNAAVRDIIAPLVEKLYVVKNSTVGGFGIRIIGATGTGVTVPNGATVWVYCDGTNFNAINTESVGNFEVNGNLTVTGNTNAANATYTGNVASSQLETDFNFIGQSNVAAATLGGTDTGVNFTGIKVAYKDATDLENATSFPLQVFTNNAAQLTVTGTGNVGIGTSSPSGKLQITNTTSLLADVTANGSTVQFRKDATPTFAASVGNALPGGSVTNDMLFGTWNGSAWSERMRVTSDGNVGIGTTNPSVKLQLQGGVFHITNGTETLRQGVTTGNGFIGMQSNHPLALFTNDVERMRITSAGNVGIGTANPIDKLTVVGGIFSIASNSPRTMLATADGAGSLGEGAIEINQNQNINYTAMRFLNNGYAVGVGTITCTTTSTAYNTSSDYRLKENIAPMTGALAKVEQLKPCTYTWKSNGEAAQGFIAHELQEVVPDAVSGEKDAVDANGKPIYQGVDTSFLVATLTAAIQEQQAIINDLKARIETLENKK